MGLALAALEAVVAACGSIELDQLARVLEASREEVLDAINQLGRMPERGVRVGVLGEQVVLEIDEAYAPLARRALGQPDRQLSRAALEVLAVVAYLQPVTRQQISEVRGVSSDGVVRTLLERGLIEEVPGSEPRSLRTSTVFLARAGMRSLEELPPLGRFVPNGGELARIESELRVEG